MRTNMPSFGKRTPFTEKAFEDFITAYTGGIGADEVMKNYEAEIDEEKRKTITDERWQCISLADIEKKNYSLDLGLIADSSLSNSEDLGEPIDIAKDALAELQSITEQLNAMIKELN